MDPMRQQPFKPLVPALAAGLLLLVAAALLVFTQAPWAQDAVGPQKGGSKPKAPPINWTPDHLSLDGDDTVSVTLTAQSAIPATTLEFVPELAPYLTASPQNLPALAKGATQTIQIAANVPAGTPMDTIDGTLHVRAGSSTIARPLPVILTLWPKESIDGVQLSYPPGMNVTRGASSIVFQPPSDQLATEVASMSVSFDRNPEHLSLDQFYDGDPGANLFGYSDPPILLQISQKVAYRFDPWLGVGANTVIIVPLDSDFLVIANIGTSPDQFAALLASIEIVEGL